MCVGFGANTLGYIMRSGERRVGLGSWVHIVEQKSFLKRYFAVCFALTAAQDFWNEDFI